MVIRVDDIRPDRFKELQKRASLADRAWVINHKSEFIDGCCPVCCQGGGKVVYEVNEVVHYARCPICNTLYLNRHLSEKGYAEFYRISENIRFFSEHIFPASRQKREERIYRPRLRRLLEICGKHLPKGQKSYCEIGAGSGQFARLVKESSFFEQTYAVEPSPHLAADCRSLGLDTIESRVEDMAGLPPDTGVVTSFECLEHLVDPAGHVRAIFSLLPQGGLFVITTPNSLGFDVLELGSASTTLGLTHIHLFNPDSLSCLLESAGFQVLEISTPGLLDVNLVQKAFRERDGENSPWLHYFLLHANDAMLDDFQNFLVEHNMSSHMWIVAMKPSIEVS